MIRIRWSARDWIEKLDGYEIGQGYAVYLNSQKIGMGSKLRVIILTYERFCGECPVGECWRFCIVDPSFVQIYGG